jgi:hypothetical protein
MHLRVCVCLVIGITNVCMFKESCMFIESCAVLETHVCRLVTQK